MSRTQRVIAAMSVILGAGFALLAIPSVILLLMMSCSSQAGLWSVVVRNESGAPCSVVLTIESDGEQERRFEDVPVRRGYDDHVLIQERGSGLIHAIKVIGPDGQERMLKRVEEVPRGAQLEITVGKQLILSTSIDYDRHM